MDSVCVLTTSDRLGGGDEALRAVLQSMFRGSVGKMNVNYVHAVP